MKRLLRRFLRSLFYFVFEELEAMSFKDDLLSAIADVSSKIDAVLANESADAAAVTLAQAAQAAAEATATQATADKDAAVAALAASEANAVSQSDVDAVKALGDKLVPPAAPEAPAA